MKIKQITDTSKYLNGELTHEFMLCKYIIEIIFHSNELLFS